MRALILILVLTLSGTLFAQVEADSTKSPAPEFFLTTIPIRCALRDINVGFARRIGFYHTLEGRLGWVHGNKMLHKHYNSWLNSSEMLFNGPSIYLQANKWRIDKKNRHTFTGIVVGYRYLFYTDKEFTVYDPDGRSYDEELTLSQWRNDLLFLISVGVGTTKFSMTEISIGARFMFTHTNVSATQRVTYFPSQEQYDEYIAYRMDQIPNDEGFNVMPIVRITSRVGWFQW